MEIASSSYCRYFNQSGGCKYSEKCRYRHEVRTRSDNRRDNERKKYNSDHKVPPTKNENFKGATTAESRDDITRQLAKQPICRYFARKGLCRDGEKCRFLHQNNKSRRSNESAESHLHEKMCQMLSTLSHNNEPKNSKNHYSINPRELHSQKRPENLSEKLSLLSDEGVEYLQSVELAQLKKRYGNDGLSIKDMSESGIQCTFSIKPTDPDWPYDIKEVPINIIFPKSYPKEIFKAEITDDDGQFPANFTRNINSNIKEHLQAHSEAQKLRDSSDLLLRPFLRWLDRNMEDLFTKSLRQIKYDVQAKSAGLEFIAFDKQTRNPMTYNTEKETDRLEIHQPHVEDPPEDFNATSLKADEKNEQSQDDSIMLKMVETRKLISTKKGAEIRLRGMDLHENTATVRATSLTFSIQCSRCKNRGEMSHVKENTEFVRSCSKCSNAQSIIFTNSEVVHQHSTTLAYINPNGCMPVDLLLTECLLFLGCLNCSKETSVKGLGYGSTKNIWCEHCHQRLDMKVESARFYQIQSALSDENNIKRVEVKKDKKSRENPLIKSGQALPNNGTCCHYKKSFRWMRFPCCGKVYPCDKCHDEVERDHDMELATRMICGYCSKEQVFTQKSCIACKASMTAVRSSHWEGGKGCRNKIKMSRGDEKKYSNQNKTTSRRAIKVEEKKRK